jgi:hypothetical protein
MQFCKRWPMNWPSIIGYHSDLIRGGNTSAWRNNETVTRDEIDDLILYDSPAIMQVIEVVIQGFSDSLPKPVTLESRWSRRKRPSWNSGHLGPDGRNRIGWTRFDDRLFYSLTPRHLQTRWTAVENAMTMNQRNDGWSHERSCIFPSY